MLELRDLQVGLQDPEGFGTGSGGVRERGQALVWRERRAGFGTCPRSGTEQLAQLVRGVDPGVERLTEERQCDPQCQPHDHPEHDVALGLRLLQRGAVGTADQRRARGSCLQRLQVLQIALGPRGDGTAQIRRRPMPRSRPASVARR